MKLSEEAILFLEEHIPELAQAAVTQAYWGALASGHSVLVGIDGMLMEVHPDGTKKAIKPLPQSTPIKKGLRIEML
jgi:hypothetical protein